MPGRIVTLIGADGSGKTTLARRLCSSVDVPARYVYMGSNPSASTHALPSTRAWRRLKRALGRTVHHAGPPDPCERRRPRNPIARAMQHLKSLLVVAGRVTEEAYRLCLVEILLRRGYLVLLDRHPFPDYYAQRVAGTRGWRRVGDRIHGFFLERVYPRPRGLILLDAPPQVLHARKPEGSRQAVEARCREYRDVVSKLPDVTVVDAARTEDEILADVLRIMDVEGSRAGRPSQTASPDGGVHASVPRVGIGEPSPVVTRAGASAAASGPAPGTSP